MRTEELVMRAADGARIAAWHAADGSLLTQPRVAQRDGVLIAGERDFVEFGVDHVQGGYEYRLWIGRGKAASFESDSGGLKSQGSVWWGCDCHFDSACGLTKLFLESRLEDSDEDWAKLVEAEIFVNPTKAGMAGIERMSEDIGRLSRGLLYDIFGKSERVHDVRALRSLRRRLRQPMDEIYGLERAVRQAEIVLGRIAARPASRMVLMQRPRKLRGSDPISSRTIRRIAARGFDTRRDMAGVTIAVDSKVESFDIPEHRILAGLLQQIADRGQKCRLFMRTVIDEIEAFRRFRDFTISGLGDELTLFEAEDQPMIEHLLEGIRRAREVYSEASRLRKVPLLRDIPASNGQISAEMFVQSPEYRAARRLVCSVRGTALAPSGGTGFVTSAKDTWRLFEQWAFLQIVESFRRAGLELGDWDESLRLNLKSRFVLDFRRGLSFDGRVGRNMRLRLRYEPFVLGKSDAIGEGETIYRSQSRVPCTPDITIELQERVLDRWVTVYATVLDVKYSRRLKEAQWSQVAKYAKIRSVGDESQVKHIGIVYLAETDKVEVWDDSDVSFSDEHGLVCEPDHRVDFCIGSMPGINGPACTGSFDHFAAGTLQFMRRHFI